LNTFEREGLKNNYVNEKEIASKEEGLWTFNEVRFFLLTSRDVKFCDHLKKIGFFYEHQEIGICGEHWKRLCAWKRLCTWRKLNAWKRLIGKHWQTSWRYLKLHRLSVDLGNVCLQMRWKPFKAMAIIAKPLCQYEDIFYDYLKIFIIWQTLYYVCDLFPFFIARFLRSCKL
jgi:hypothetical protein